MRVSGITREMVIAWGRRAAHMGRCRFCLMPGEDRDETSLTFEGVVLLPARTLTETGVRSTLWVMAPMICERCKALSMIAVEQIEVDPEDVAQPITIGSQDP